MSYVKSSDSVDLDVCADEKNQDRTIRQSDYLIDNHLRGGIMANNPRRGGMERRAGKSGFAARPGAESRREGDCEP